MIISKNKLFLASLTLLASLSYSHKAFAMDDDSNAKILTPLHPLQDIHNLTDFARLPRKNNIPR